MSKKKAKTREDYRTAVRDKSNKFEEQIAFLQGIKLGEIREIAIPPKMGKSKAARKAAHLIRYHAARIGVPEGYVLSSRVSDSVVQVFLALEGRRTPAPAK